MTAEEYLELALAYINERNWMAALGSLKESQKRFSEGPPELIPGLLFSALGLSITMAENKIQEGLNYCRRASEIEPHQPEFYLHLGMIYLKAGKKGKAVAAFRRGLRLDTRHSDIRAQLARMGVRKRPLLPFLSRDHFLNRFLGVWFVEGKKE